MHYFCGSRNWIQHRNSIGKQLLQREKARSILFAFLPLSIIFLFSLFERGCRTRHRKERRLCGRSTCSLLVNHCNSDPGKVLRRHLPEVVLPSNRALGCHIRRNRRSSSGCCQALQLVLMKRCQRLQRDSRGSCELSHWCSNRGRGRKSKLLLRLCMELCM